MNINLEVLKKNRLVYYYYFRSLFNFVPFEKTLIPFRCYKYEAITRGKKVQIMHDVKDIFYYF